MTKTQIMAFLKTAAVALVAIAVANRIQPLRDIIKG